MRSWLLCVYLGWLQWLCSLYLIWNHEVWNWGDSLNFWVALVRMVLVCSFEIFDLTKFFLFFLVGFLCCYCRVRFMQRAAQKEEKSKDEEEETKPDGNFISPSNASRKWYSFLSSHFLSSFHVLIWVCVLMSISAVIDLAFFGFWGHCGCKLVIIVSYVEFCRL